MSSKQTFWLIALVSLSGSANAAEEPDCRFKLAQISPLAVHNKSGQQIGGLLGGALGSLIAGAGSKPNNDDDEIIVKKFMDQVSIPELLKTLDNRYTEKSDRNALCMYEVSVDERHLQWENGYSTVSLKFTIEKYNSGNLTSSEQKKFSKLVRSVPTPTPPKPRFERGKMGRWIDVTPPAPSNEQAAQQFLPLYEKAVKAVLTELIKKKIT